MAGLIYLLHNHSLVHQNVDHRTSQQLRQRRGCCCQRRRRRSSGWLGVSHEQHGTTKYSLDFSLWGWMTEAASSSLPLMASPACSRYDFSLSGLVAEPICCQRGCGGD